MKERKMKNEGDARIKKAAEMLAEEIENTVKVLDDVDLPLDMANEIGMNLVKKYEGQRYDKLVDATLAAAYLMCANMMKIDAKDWNAYKKVSEHIETRARMVFAAMSARCAICAINIAFGSDDKR